MQCLFAFQTIKTQFSRYKLHSNIQRFTLQGTEKYIQANLKLENVESGWVVYLNSPDESGIQVSYRMLLVSSTQIHFD